MADGEDLGKIVYVLGEDIEDAEVAFDARLKEAASPESSGWRVRFMSQGDTQDPENAGKGYMVPARFAKAIGRGDSDPIVVQDLGERITEGYLDTLDREDLDRVFFVIADEEDLTGLEIAVESVLGGAPHLNISRIGTLGEVASALKNQLAGEPADTADFRYEQTVYIVGSEGAMDRVGRVAAGAQARMFSLYGEVGSVRYQDPDALVARVNKSSENDTIVLQDGIGEGEAGRYAQALLDAGVDKGRIFVVIDDNEDPGGLDTIASAVAMETGTFRERVGNLDQVAGALGEYLAGNRGTSTSDYRMEESPTEAGPGPT